MDGARDRVPPGQTLTRGWPVLHYGDIPYYRDMSKWDLKVFGLVEEEAVFSYKEFMKLPRRTCENDIHCVTAWSKLDNVWEGVPVSVVMERVKPRPEAAFVMLHAEHGWSTNLPLADFLRDTSLFAIKHNGEILSPEHGYPVRMVVPHLYFWKSAKWLRGIEFMDKDKPASGRGTGTICAETRGKRKGTILIESTESPRLRPAGVFVCFPGKWG